MPLFLSGHLKAAIIVPDFKQQPRGHGRGTTTEQELQDRALSRTPSSPPETVAPVSPPSADPLGSPRAGPPREREETGGEPGGGDARRGLAVTPQHLRGSAPGTKRSAPCRAARGPGAGLPPAAGRWEPVIGEAAD